MTTSTIEVNGERQPLHATTLAALLKERSVDLNSRGLAVAVNGAVVPRAEWRNTALRAGDAVEIVRALQGG